MPIHLVLKKDHYTMAGFLMFFGYVVTELEKYENEHAIFSDSQSTGILKKNNE